MERVLPGAHWKGEQHISAHLCFVAERLKGNKEVGNADKKSKIQTLNTSVTVYVYIYIYIYA